MIYVADGHRIRKINPVTGIIDSVVGKGYNHYQSSWRPPQFMYSNDNSFRYSCIIMSNDYCSEFNKKDRYTKIRLKQSRYPI